MFTGPNDSEVNIEESAGKKGSQSMLAMIGASGGGIRST